MAHDNIEIKCRYKDLKQVRNILKHKGAVLCGRGRQIDTYYKVPKGRLKIRKCKFENNLIYYEREDLTGPKHSRVMIVDLEKNPEIEEIIKKLFDVLIVVDKQRELYSISNLRFHIDKVKGLGNFVEIEVVDKTGDVGLRKLNSQCNHYMKLLKIDKSDLIDSGYSDLLLGKH